MGQVFLARQESLDRRVAVKFLRLEPGSSGDERFARFRREAKVLSNVNHPNVVTVFDSGVSEGCPFLVMEYFEGCSLRGLLEVDKPLPIERACSILRPLAIALTHLHERGIVHRDLKPENVLLDDQEWVKICDFGIASELCEIGSATHSGEIIGTVDYMAPEQRCRLEVDELADQFSFSVIAYEMLTGRKPLGAFKAPSKHNPILNSEVDSVILRGLQENAEDRYPTIRGLWEALDRSLHSIGVRRGRRIVGVIAALAILLTTVGVLVANFGTDRSDTHLPQREGTTTESPRFIEPKAEPEQVRAKDASEPTEDAEELRHLTVEELRAKAKERGYVGYSQLRKVELIELLVQGPQPVKVPPGWTTEIKEDSIGRRYRSFIAPDGRQYRKLPEWAVASKDAPKTAPTSHP